MYSTAKSTHTRTIHVGYPIFGTTAISHIIDNHSIMYYQLNMMDQLEHVNLGLFTYTQLVYSYNNTQ